MATPDELKALQSELHAELLKELLRRVKSGEAKAGDLGVAQRFLKDNDVQSDLNDAPDLSELLRHSAMPFSESTPEEIMPLDVLKVG